jgi:hypothetical protein
MDGIRQHTQSVSGTIDNLSVEILERAAASPSSPTKCDSSLHAPVNPLRR